MPLTRSKFHEFHLSLNPVTEAEFSVLMNQLNNSAVRYDGINSIDATITAISCVLFFLCNTSLTTGIYPDKLNTAKVTPGHKSGKEKEKKLSVSDWNIISYAKIF